VVAGAARRQDEGLARKRRAHAAASTSAGIETLIAYVKSTGRQWENLIARCCCSCHTDMIGYLIGNLIK